MEHSSANPLVSVIMITYNQERYIDEAIRGVIMQQVDFPYELIVANDASTDNTASHVKKWADRYPDIIRFIDRPKNLGLQLNYLDAFSKCKGKYIAICEGDDWWCSRHKLSIQAKYMESHAECSVCFHRVVNYFADTRTMSLSNGGQKSDLTLNDLCRSNVITNLSVMYRAIPASEIPEWVSKITLFDYAMHSLHAAHGDIHYINRPMAVYRQNINGIWSGQIVRQLDMAMQVREHLMLYFADNETVRNGYMDAYVSIGLNYAAHMLIDGKDDKVDDVYQRIESHLNPYRHIDKNDFISQAKTRAANLTAKKPLKKRIIRKLRETVSRFIPTPRIR